MNTIRFALALTFPLVILAVGTLAPKWSGLPTADPLTKTMLTGCVRLSTPIRATLRGAAKTAKVAGRFAVVGWIAAVAVLVVAAFTAAVIASTVNTFDRAILIGWVLVVAAVGTWKPTAAAAEETDPFFTMALHLAAVRAAAPTKANAKAGADKDGNPTTAGQHWGLSNFKTRTNEHDDRKATYGLPDGLVVSDITGTQAALDRFITRLGPTLSSDEVTVGAYQNRPSQIEVTILAPRAPMTGRTPNLTDATDWRKPVTLGRNEHTGTDITSKTRDVGPWLLAGRTRSGKTVAARLPVAHFALDPTTILWGFDGKGDADDWLPMRHRFARWVTGPERDSGALAVAMLEDLNAEADRRQQLTRANRGPGLFVLLEELPKFRSRMDSKQLAAFDKNLNHLVSTCASANMLVLFVAQYPTKEAIPVAAKQQASTRLVFNSTAGNAELALGVYPDGHEPDKLPQGTALLNLGDITGITRLVTDWLDDEQWLAFCESMPSAEDLGQVPPTDGPAAQDTQAATASPQDKPAPVVDELPHGHIWMQFRDGTIGGVPGLLAAAYTALNRDGQPPETICSKLLPLIAAEVAGHQLLTETVTVPGDASALGTVLGDLGVENRKRTLPHHPPPKEQQRWVTLADVEMALDLSAVGRHVPAGTG